MTGFSRSKRDVMPPNPCGRVPALAALGLVLQIVARRERLVAGSGDDRHPLVGVGGEGVEDGVELVVCRGVQRVVDLGAVDRDHGDVAVVFDAAELVAGHRFPLVVGVGTRQ